MEDSPGYKEGFALGSMMAEARNHGNDSYDCRWDLADAAKNGKDYSKAFRDGLSAALEAGRRT